MGNGINDNQYNQAAFNHAPIGVTVFDKDMNVIECNDTILKLLGTSREDYIKNFFKYIPEYQPNGDKSYEKALEISKRVLNGEPMTVEWTHISTDGEVIPFEVTLVRVKEKDKYFGLGYQYDLRRIKKITEEMKKQSALQKVRLGQQELISEISRSFISSASTQTLVKEAIAKLGNYYEVSSVVIFNLDYESGDASLAYQWTFDKKLLDRENFNTRDLIKESFPERLYNSASVPIISCADISASHEDVFRRLVSLGVNAFICAPLYVEGKLWGMFVVEQHGTTRHWTDNEKSFVAMTASTIAGAIMLDIYNTKLKDAITEVTAASKAKSEFLSNMSHEMRTPMNAIINMTAIAKNSSDIERKNYALDKIGDASSHLLGVINDILDMSKIEANKFELSPIEFNFEKMIGRVVNVINFRVEEKHQKLTVEIGNDIPNCLIGDDQRISQIITNLLGNAVKFTPENGTISLFAKLLGEKNGICTIQINVIDTGIGINEENQKKLFKSFNQADPSTSRKYGGTGLGLSISKSFVEMMGGKIWVESEYGNGATFAFTMQVQRGKGNEEEKKPDKEQIELREIFTGHKILLVEDMEINREIVLMLLESTKLEIDCAINGLQAVDMFLEDPLRYEMIFMDVHMPGMDGYEATRQIRMYETKLKEKGKVQKRVPIIAMTANVFKEDIENCINAGMDGHLGKPLDFEVIMQYLRDYLAA